MGKLRNKWTMVPWKDKPRYYGLRTQEGKNCVFIIRKSTEKRKIHKIGDVYAVRSAQWEE